MKSQVKILPLRQMLPCVELIDKVINKKLLISSPYKQIEIQTKDYSANDYYEKFIIGLSFTLGQHWRCLEKYTNNYYD